MEHWAQMSYFIGWKISRNKVHQLLHSLIRVIIDYLAFLILRNLTL